MSNSLSAQHISANLANYEAARTGFFSLIVDDLDNTIRATFSGDAGDATENDKIARAQETLKLNVIKAPVPHFGVEVLKYKRGNDTVTFAVTREYESGSITVYDFVGMHTKAILIALQSLSYNVYTRKGGRMKDYKKNCTLIEYTQDFEQVRSWTLYGCWISKITEGEFDKENDGKRQITADLKYDRAEMHAN